MNKIVAVVLLSIVSTSLCTLNQKHWKIKRRNAYYKGTEFVTFCDSTQEKRNQNYRFSQATNCIIVWKQDKTYAGTMSNKNGVHELRSKKAEKYYQFFEENAQ